MRTLPKAFVEAVNEMITDVRQGIRGEMEGKPYSARCAVRSHAERAHYDIEDAKAILDDGRFGYLATAFSRNEPHLVPMMYVRQGDCIHLHGRARTLLMDHLLGGSELVFAVTLVDGVVLARNVRFNSLNYRSLVIHGKATEIVEESRKRASFSALAQQSWPGRDKIAMATAEQLASVNLLELPIKEFAVKIRTGGPATPSPGDDMSVWGGHVDFRTVPGEFHRDRATPSEVVPPQWPF